MKSVFAIFAVLGIAALSQGAFAGGHLASESAGSCNYIMKNMFAGPFKVCQTNQDVAACATIGQTDENSDASHMAGDCSGEGTIGSCVMADASVVYYEGDPVGLEIGCGFQGGTWEAAE